ncbi:hypothetical protein [Actinotalea sp. K2]|uniref:hypothetical protein n=1 Tax=Actinotalea sp. K2 TaxID=2939438 RepID=UPI00201776B1|nr:hypothetical protein [Actinotalea sp. K2]MCL3861973.1 hypothetical protein [Actinotalea sp. K2]
MTATAVRGRRRPVTAGLTAAAVTWAARRVLGGLDPGRAARWTRINHRGEPISLLEGPAVAAGLLAGAVAGRGGRAAVAGAVATLGGAVLGLVDDLSEDAARSRKGLRGHLGALAHGELTTGGLKVLGIGGTSLVAAAVATPSRGSGSLARTAWLGDVLVSGALVAATANLVNLLDLRPGRALKAGSVLSVAGLAGAGASAAASCLGAAGAAISADLDERDMLGDGGANALGALAGTALVLSCPRPARLGLLAGAIALTVASERVSFTAVIERTPWLRALDMAGRRQGSPASADGEGDRS